MTERRYRKGDPVRFQLGTRSIEGVVKEDRGPIGINGRHLFLVEFCPDPDNASVSLIELPAEQLQAVQDRVSTE